MKNDRPIRLAFDHQIFSSQVYGGISRYFSNLAQQLSYHDDIEMKVIAPLYVNSYLKNLNSEYVRGIPIRMLPKTGRLRSIINGLVAPIQIKAFGPDIVHETYYSFRAYAPAQALRVITVYDMIHERYAHMIPQSASLTAMKRFAVNRADSIICISENTRQDLLSFFGIPEEKVSTVHLGFDFLRQEINGPVDTGPSKPYLLYVGARHGYKNFDRLIQAYALLNLIRNHMNLVCFGGGSFTSAEKASFSDNHLSDKQITHVAGNDLDLAKYYQQALAFIYPSLFEGFGIPLLEAMALNCPVICSNISSLPEVAGDAAEYFNPENPEEIAKAIERVVDSSLYRSELINRGKVRCAQFSWKKCADQTLNIYRSLL